MLDANRDGDLSVVDVSWLFKNRNDPLVQWLTHVYDLNDDGKVNVVDVTKLFWNQKKGKTEDPVNIHIYQSKKLKKYLSGVPDTPPTACVDVAKEYIKVSDESSEEALETLKEVKRFWKQMEDDIDD